MISKEKERESEREKNDRNFSYLHSDWKICLGEHEMTLPAALFQHKETVREQFRIGDDPGLEQRCQIVRLRCTGLRAKERLENFPCKESTKETISQQNLWTMM
jgi:hypothetical protein